MLERKSPVVGLIEGVAIGAGLDSFMAAATLYVPELIQPSPLKIPELYDPAGVHYDDLIALGIGAIVGIAGAAQKDTSIALKGLGMVAGSILISQFQAGMKTPDWQLAKNSAQPMAQFVSAYQPAERQVMVD